MDRNYSIDPTDSTGFRHSRQSLKAKSVDLKEKGLGNKNNRSDPFTSEDIKDLYDKKLLGNGRQLHLTPYYVNVT
ncbi:hypothetical protein DPMN_111278 [Dreissena polymorpha]|uniref:Uncharacterized protein n=1 Tax=Dreissena polymorpha TaxID=45954 RepID=A0A9D4KDZ9_DREPO|nr:hypothetical protein DPMN_111278 [Dreissena polymorpha]